MNILAVALQKDGKLVPASFEVIQAAKSLGGVVHTAILAADASAVADDLAKRGGGKVLAVSNPSLAAFNDESYTRVISELVGKHYILAVLGPATFYGKALFARLAGRNGGRVSPVRLLMATGW